MSYDKYQRWKDRPIAGEPWLTVVIPAYNEAGRILPTLGAIASYVSNLDLEGEVLVVDDGSQDETARLVEDLGLANVRVLPARHNGGKGSAVRRGILAARGRFVLVADADNSTPIEALDQLLECVRGQGYDLAIGSRAAQGAQEAHRTWLRRTLSAGLRWLVRAALRVGVRDTQCGFKLYTREAARRLHAAQTIGGFSFDLEILYLAAKWGLRVAEVPVAWVDSPGSKLDVRREVQRFVRDIARIRLNDLRGRYRTA